MSLRRNRQIRQQFIKSRRVQNDEAWRGKLGDINGVVAVPGQPEFRYVRPLGSDLAVVVRRGPVGDVKDTRIWVGPDPYNRRIVRILGLDVGVDQSTSSLEAHAPTHYEDGSDPVWITDRQITPLLAYATTGMYVHVNSGYIVYQGQAFWVASDDILMTATPGSGAQYSLIRASSAGALDVQGGTPVASLPDLTDDDIPVCELGYAAIAFVRLYFGQTALSKLTSNPDVKMLLWGGGLFDISGFSGFDDSEGNPDDVDATAADDGTSEYAARRDHRHHLGDHDHVEADITDLDHDAVKLQGRDLASDDPEDGEALVWNDDDEQWEPGVVAGGGGRELLTDNRTYYVRADGDDLNDGLADSAEGAFRQIQHAIDIIASTIDMNGYNIEIQCGAGSYDAIILENIMGFSYAGTLQIISTGDSIIGTDEDSYAIYAYGLTTIWYIMGVSLKAAEYCVWVEINTSLYLASPDYLICESEEAGHIYCGNHSFVSLTGGSIEGGTIYRHIKVTDMSSVRTTGGVMFYDDLIVDRSFVDCSDNSMINADGTTYILGEYSVTGIRYKVRGNSFIYTDGEGEEFYPGDEAGVADEISGGIYDELSVSPGTPDASDVTYTPAEDTDWDGDADPGDVDGALDQLAERVDDIEGGVGHDAVTLDGDAANILDLSTQEIGLDVQDANTIFAGPLVGPANEPTFRALVAADLGNGWWAATGTWTPRSQAYTNDPAAGANIELEMVDTTGFEVGDVVNVSSSAGSENALVTVVHANVHLTVAVLYYNHTTTNPLVRLASTLYVARAYTNDPAAGNNIELNMASTTGFAVGDLVEVSSSAGRENATVTVVHVDTHLTVNTLALNHTTTAPMVKQVVQNTFIVDMSDDLSGSIGVGHKIKVTDSTVKYFIVVAIAATRLTLYGGTDYSIVSTSALSSPYYSIAKAPFGFTLDPIKWTWEVTDTASRVMATPTINVWYNIITLSVPIGCWLLMHEDNVGCTDASAGSWGFQSTLSTANNTESDTKFTVMVYHGSDVDVYSPIHRQRNVNLVTKTHYYLNVRTIVANLDNIVVRGDRGDTIIRAVCAYL